MLGEIRDGPTAQMAVRSSLTGHLLFSTIPTNTAWGAVARLADMGGAPLSGGQYAGDDRCPAARAPAVPALQAGGSGDQARCGGCFPDMPPARYYEPVGCERCFYTGYSGRACGVRGDPHGRRTLGSGPQERCRHRPLLSAGASPRCAMPLSGFLLRGETSLEELIPLVELLAYEIPFYLLVLALSPVLCCAGCRFDPLCCRYRPQVGGARGTRLDVHARSTSRRDACPSRNCCATSPVRAA